MESGPLQGRVALNYTAEIPNASTVVENPTPPRTSGNLFLSGDSQEGTMLLRSLSGSVTKQNEEKRVKQQMAEAIARYEGPITKCPPARARGTEHERGAGAA